MFKVTVTPVTEAFAGIPATVILLVAPAALLSGTGTLAVDANVAVPGIGGAKEPVLNNNPLMPATPPQAAAGVIATTGNTLTVNLTQFEVTAVGHIPLTIQR